MSQAQPVTQTLALSKDQHTTLKALTITGYLEGMSFLSLLGIAMPLKYMMDMPEAVRYVGMAHGVLFIAYIAMLMMVVNKIKTPVWTMPAGVLGSFLPFGPFIFDHFLKKSLKKSNGKRSD